MVFLDCGMTACVFRIYRLLYLKRVSENYTSINLTLKIGIFLHQTQGRGLPGGSVVKKPPVNARDTGLIPGLGRPHMP